ncbi:protein arginine N-methyltransferase 1-like [Teleopsis dalmanni]|uniref:protein arginine N-methyltransferase 1-like n=1 Tax=Teleopsis dalmanni TaxID=139649 RepID=UPI0018CCC2F8|nr:protein arginine N-methyltransferase 1-like [Teleopsis dalmanni]
MDKISHIKRDEIRFKHDLEVNKMTSREFYQDPRARVDYQQYILRDTEYFNLFKLAILYNKHLFVNRTVLNLNCELGLLALFAAKAGAKTVYAIDDSKVVDYTRQVVASNGFEHIINVIEGNIRTIKLPTKVDIIIADWLGYTLLFESTCADVIYARDHWLKDSGIIFPDIARMFLLLGQNTENRNAYTEWWHNVHGFNMKALRQSVTKTPKFQYVGKENLLTDRYEIYDLDMNTATIADLKVRSQFIFNIKRSCTIDVAITYFEAKFSKSHIPVYIRTNPSCKRSTRFKQGIFYFNKPVNVEASSLLYGGIEMCPAQFNTDFKCIDINFELYAGNPGNSNLLTEMHWRLPSYFVERKTKPRINVVNNKQTIVEKVEIVDQLVKDEKDENKDINGNKTEEHVKKVNEDAKCNKDVEDFNKHSKTKKNRKKKYKKII